MLIYNSKTCVVFPICKLHYCTPSKYNFLLGRRTRHEDVTVVVSYIYIHIVYLYILYTIRCTQKDMTDSDADIGVKRLLNQQLRYGR